MKRLGFVLLVLLVSGCGKRPYTSQREALGAQIAKIKSAAAKARQAMPSLGPISGDGDGKGSPAKLGTPLRLGGMRGDDASAPAANALLLPVEKIATLGVLPGRGPSAPEPSAFFDVGSGLSCLSQATLVLEKDDCGIGDCRSEWAGRCADYLLGLRYVLVVVTDTRNDVEQTRAVSSTERYAGRAMLVDLTTMESWPAIAFSGDQSNVDVHRKIDYKDPLPIALFGLGERLTKQFPGATVPAEWSKKPAP